MARKVAEGASLAQELGEGRRRSGLLLLLLQPEGASGSERGDRGRGAHKIAWDGGKGGKEGKSKTEREQKLVGRETR